MELNFGDLELFSWTHGANFMDNRSFSTGIYNDTEYLLKDKQLLKAVDDIKNGKNLVSVPIENI